MITDNVQFGLDSRLELAFAQEIKEKFPGVQLRRGHSSTFGFQQEVVLDGMSEDEYCAWVIARGWRRCSSLTQAKNDEFDRLYALAIERYPKAFGE